jgi:hypothetical protein
LIAGVVAPDDAHQLRAVYQLAKLIAKPIVALMSGTEFHPLNLISSERSFRIAIVAAITLSS